jgi:poly(ADP-ribose) glycohydrolase ARH3
MKIDMKAKFLGGLLGSAIGDALGELAFHQPSWEGLLRLVDSSLEIHYTDDTAMAIGLAESLIRSDGLDQQDLGETFRKNYLQEPWRGYASGPPTLFSMVLREGISYARAAKQLFEGKGSLGNGAAMRVGPLGLLFYGDPRLYEKAVLSAEVTHAHRVGMDGAAIQALAVSQAVVLNAREPFDADAFIGNLVDVAKTGTMRQKLESLSGLIKKGCLPTEAADRLGRSVAVHESLPFALYAFLTQPKSFEDCLSCAILNGGDRDTLGAMACAVSGAYLGVGTIPSQWRRNLENRAYLENLAETLLQIRQGWDGMGKEDKRAWKLSPP